MGKGEKRMELKWNRREVEREKKEYGSKEWKQNGGRNEKERYGGEIYYGERWKGKKK